MAEPIPKSASQRPPSLEAWRKALLNIPTLFGRLAYLASMRDPVTGRYQNEEVAKWIGPDDADRTLNRIHHQLFSQWLEYTLAEQKNELMEYLSAVGGPRLAYYYLHLIPNTARDVERQLYLTDLETLFDLLRYEHGAS